MDLWPRFKTMAHPACAFGFAWVIFVVASEAAGFYKIKLREFLVWSRERRRAKGRTVRGRAGPPTHHETRTHTHILKPTKITKNFWNHAHTQTRTRTKVELARVELAKVEYEHRGVLKHLHGKRTQSLRPLSRDPADTESGGPKHGWQHEAASRVERHLRDVIMPTLADHEKALMRSQSGPCEGVALSVVYINFLTRIDPSLFRVRRLRFPLPLSLRFCRCDRPRHHRSATSRAGVVGKDGICRRERRCSSVFEGRVALNVMVRDMDLAVPGVSHWGRWVRQIRCGIALVQAWRKKERAYAELMGPRSPCSSRCLGWRSRRQVVGGTTDIPWHLGTRPIRAEDPPESTAGVEDGLGCGAILGFRLDQTNFGRGQKIQKKKSGSNKSEKCQARKRWVTLMCCQLRQFIRCITKPLPSPHLPPSSPPTV